MFLFNCKLLTNHIHLITRPSEISGLDRLLSTSGICLFHHHPGNSVSYLWSIFYFLDPIHYIYLPLLAYFSF